MSENTFRFNFEVDLSNMNDSFDDGGQSLDFFEQKVKQLEAELGRLDAESAKNARQQEKLTTALKRGAITADQYEAQIASLVSEEKLLVKSTADAERQIRRFNASISRLRGGYAAAGKSTAKALPLVQEFGRAIQDAPFGIIGVGNNLTQMGDAFGVLSRKVGGARAALAIFGRALIGPAGILVAFSAVISIITVFARKAQRGSSSTASALEKLRKEVEELIAPFEQLRRLASLQEDIADLRGNSALPAIRNQLTLLDIELALLNTRLESEKQALRQAQIEAGRVDTAEALYRLGKQTFNLAAANALLIARTLGDLAVEALFGDIQKLSEIINKGFRIDEDAFGPTKDELAAVEDAQKRVNALDIKRTEILKGIQVLLKKEAQILTDALGEIGAKFFNFFSQFSDDIAFIGLRFFDLASIVKEKAKEMGGDLITLAINANEFTYALLEGLAAFTNWVAEQTEELREFKELTENLFEDLQKDIKEGLGPALSEMGNTIGRELARGTNFVTAFGKGFLAAFSSLVSRVADTLIAFGAEVLLLGKLEAALLTFNPFGKIATGLAAIALGLALKGAGSAAAQAAGGSTTAGGSNFTPNQQFIGSTGGGGGGFSSGGFGGTVVFEIAGTKLVGVLDRTLKNKNRSVGDIIS